MAKTLDDVLPDSAVIHLPNVVMPTTGRDIKEVIRKEVLRIVTASPKTLDDFQQFVREGEKEA